MHRRIQLHASVRGGSTSTRSDLAADRAGPPCPLPGSALTIAFVALVGCGSSVVIMDESGANAGGSSAETTVSTGGSSVAAGVGVASAGGGDQGSGASVGASGGAGNGGPECTAIDQCPDPAGECW